jgi:hypothetical protein
MLEKYHVGVSNRLVYAGGGLGVKSAKPHQNLIFLESFTFQFIEAGLGRFVSKIDSNKKGK